jgi:alkanesulfonate monooxygenase SsuD/methylene tetrahydromethanopterin reductase-like flavin-dependent oxidoreductase (luciferase family)
MGERESRMHYGVCILPDARWEAAQRRWILAEALGFDHAWTYDHLTWRTLRESAWFASIPTLTAAACRTKSIRLGTLVASPNFRDPAPFAKELMTLDDVTGGRLTLGFGAGAEGFDSTATRNERWTIAERHARFAEFVQVLDGILRNERYTHSGTYYVANEVRTIPSPTQLPRIPFALAATGARGMRVVARYAETWVAVDSRGVGKGQVDTLERAMAEAGRDPSSIRRLVLLGHVERPLSSSDEFMRLSDQYERLGFTDVVVHWPRTSEPFEASMGVLEEVAKLIALRRR